ncbi:PadR family transcriptional regulator [candidate division KSB1 bacterium]
MKFMTRQEEMVLLGVYLQQGEVTLKDIRKYLIKQTSKDWSVSSVYVPLDRLTEGGFLSYRIGKPSGVRGGKAKKYYRISIEGIQALKDLRKLTDSMWKNAEELAFEG